VAVEIALNSDGSLRELKLNKPSGVALLDDSALRNVRMASPYAPFPPNIRRNTGVLRFVYVWRFNGGKLDTRRGGVSAAAVSP
jgi:protein TonB